MMIGESEVIVGHSCWYLAALPHVPRHSKLEASSGEEPDDG